MMKSSNIVSVNLCDTRASSAAYCIFKSQFELPLHLGQEVGDGAARFGDRQHQAAEAVAVALPGGEQHSGGERTVHRVLAVVASVVPAARAIARDGGLPDIVEVAVAQVTGAMRERRVLVGERHRGSAARAVEAEHRGGERRLVNVVPDREDRRATDARHVDVVRVGIVERGEVADRDHVAAGVGDRRGQVGGQRRAVIGSAAHHERVGRSGHRDSLGVTGHVPDRIDAHVAVRGARNACQHEKRSRQQGTDDEPIGRPIEQPIERRRSRATATARGKPGLPNHGGTIGQGHCRIQAWLRRGALYL